MSWRGCKRQATEDLQVFQAQASPLHGAPSRGALGSALDALARHERQAALPDTPHTPLAERLRSWQEAKAAPVPDPDPAKPEPARSTHAGYAERQRAGLLELRLGWGRRGPVTALAPPVPAAAPTDQAPLLRTALTAVLIGQSRSTSSAAGRSKSLVHVAFLLTEPERPVLRLQDYGHAVMDRLHRSVCFRGQQAERPHYLPVCPLPALPQGRVPGRGVGGSHRGGRWEGLGCDTQL